MCQIPLERANTSANQTTNTTEFDPLLGQLVVKAQPGKRVG